MPPPPDQQQRYIEIWAKAVETQMHFNEMSVKSRQLGLTFVAAALGVAVVLMSRGADFAISVPAATPYVQIHISVILVLGALLALYAVRTLDLHVYHKMLRGAVTFGEDFEEQYMKQIFDLNKGMTQSISHFSRHDDAGHTLEPDTGKYQYTGSSRITAEDKIRSFYRHTFRFLGGAVIVLFLLTTLWLDVAQEPEDPPSEKSPVVTDDAYNQNAR